MIKNHSNLNVINVLQSYENDESYFFFRNRFKINSIKILPFKDPTKLKISLLIIIDEESDFILEAQYHEESENNYYCYNIVGLY